MIPIGLCTICFNTLPIDDALAIAGDADARGVEIWGGEHLPADAAAAEVQRVRRLAENLGVIIAAYGAYARAGDASWDAIRFSGVLDRAHDLGTACVRVWAGTRASADATPDDWDDAIATLQRWGDLAAAHNLHLVVERHCQSLTDYGDTARRLIDLVGHPAVHLNYQVPFPWDIERYHSPEMTADLRLHLPVSSHLHIQQYNIVDGAVRRVPIADGVIDYAAWPPLLAEAGMQGWAMLEFLPEISPLSPLELARQELAALRACWSHSR